MKLRQSNMSIIKNIQSSRPRSVFGQMNVTLSVVYAKEQMFCLSPAILEFHIDQV